MTEHLSFNHLMTNLHAGLDHLPDYRTGKNTQYTIKDAALAAFSVFFTQSPSFLAHQRLLERSKGRNNAATVFGVENLPCDNQIRNLLDPIDPEHLYPLFWDVYDQLKANGYLTEYLGFAQNLLISLDGLQYFTSKTIACPNCGQKQNRDGTINYSHAAITPMLLAPHSNQVIALEPEFTSRQDGSDKQDCEQNAIKRWIKRNASKFPKGGVTILADDLHCKQPFCRLLLDNGFNFILVCKPSSHPTLYQSVEALQADGGVDWRQSRKWNGRFHEVWNWRYVNQLPLRDSADAIQVNWCELIITRADDAQILYHNGFATNHWLADETVKPIVKAGRARWKCENEGNNVLKNHGYHLEHNYGHGHQYLSMVLLTLNLLAFLFHTVFGQIDKKYQLLRQVLGARVTFFNDLRALTRYFVFDSWDHLLDFMLNQLEIDLPP